MPAMSFRQDVVPSIAITADGARTPSLDWWAVSSDLMATQYRKPSFPSHAASTKSQREIVSSHIGSRHPHSSTLVEWASPPTSLLLDTSAPSLLSLDSESLDTPVATPLAHSFNSDLQGWRELYPRLILTNTLVKDCAKVVDHIARDVCIDLGSFNEHFRDALVAARTEKQPESPMPTDAGIDILEKEERLTVFEVGRPLSEREQTISVDEADQKAVIKNLLDEICSADGTDGANIYIMNMILQEVHASSTHDPASSIRELLITALLSESTNVRKIMDVLGDSGDGCDTDGPPKIANAEADVDMSSIIDALQDNRDVLDVSRGTLAVFRTNLGHLQTALENKVIGR